MSIPNGMKTGNERYKESPQPRGSVVFHRTDIFKVLRTEASLLTITKPHSAVFPDDDIPHMDILASKYKGHLGMVEWGLVRIESDEVESFGNGGPAVEPLRQVRVRRERANAPPREPSSLQRSGTSRTGPGISTSLPRISHSCRMYPRGAYAM